MHVKATMMCDLTRDYVGLNGIKEPAKYFFPGIKADKRTRQKIWGPML
jgi:hypothetical protein